MIIFAVGAALGVVQFIVSLIRRPIPRDQFNHPIQAVLWCAFMGAVIYGTAINLLLILLHFLGAI